MLNQQPRCAASTHVCVQQPELPTQGLALSERGVRAPLQQSVHCPTAEFTVLFQKCSRSPTTSTPGRYTVDRELLVLTRVMEGSKPTRAQVLARAHLAVSAILLSDQNRFVHLNSAFLPAAARRSVKAAQELFLSYSVSCKMPPDDDTSGLLLYDLDIGAGRVLKIISDPCHSQHPYCCGNGLWTACVELIAVLAGARLGCSAKRTRLPRSARGP